MPQVLYQSQDVEAYFEDAGGDWLLVTFNAMNQRADGRSFWGDSIARKWGVSALGIVSTRPNWFPERSMGGLLDAIAPLRGRFAEIVCYGTSMGAYGAVRWGGAMGASTIVAFSPQYSIDPAIVGDNDPRYPHYFKPEVNTGNPIAPAHFRDGQKTFVFLDPLHAEDDYSGRMIAAQDSGTVVIPVYGVGHGSIQPFAGERRAGELMDLCRRGDVAAIRTLTRQNRRPHRLRQESLILRAIPRHFGWATRMMEAAVVLHDHPRWETFAVNVVEAGRLDEALAWARDLLARNPESPNFMRVMAVFEARSGDLDAAHRLMTAAVEADPGSPDIGRHAVALFRQIGAHEAAIAQALSLTQSEPRHPQNALALIQAAMAAERFDLAVESAEDAMQAFPKNGVFERVRAWARSGKLAVETGTLDRWRVEQSQLATTAHTE